MKIADFADFIEPEALSIKPEVNSNALFINIFPKVSPCCIRQCCPRGKSIKGSAIYPHEQGIVIQKGGIFLLNNRIEVPCPPKANELEVYRNGDTKVLDWIMPVRRIVRAIEHPWGAILFESESTFEETSDGEFGFLIALLVLPH